MKRPPARSKLLVWSPLLRPSPTASRLSPLSRPVGSFNQKNSSRPWSPHWGQSPGRRKSKRWGEKEKAIHSLSQNSFIVSKRLPDLSVLHSKAFENYLVAYRPLGLDNKSVGKQPACPTAFSWTKKLQRIFKTIEYTPSKSQPRKNKTDNIWQAPLAECCLAPSCKMLQVHSCMVFHSFSIFLFGSGRSKTLDGMQQNYKK